MKQTIQPLARQHDLVVQDLINEILIYDLSINKAFCLNQTSALVWQYSNGNNSVSEIADLMSKKLKTLVTEEIVWLALDQLKKDDLLENSGEFEIAFNGLSRRQVIRKIGLASMIALPLVTSVIAPTVANAQSACFAPGTTGCTFAGGTQSNCCDSNQRCLFSANSTCSPCGSAGGLLSICSGSGCCVSVSTTACCNPGPALEDTFPGGGALLACYCP